MPSGDMDKLRERGGRERGERERERERHTWSERVDILERLERVESA
jgi:hypothetical protein